MNGKLMQQYQNLQRQIDQYQLPNKSVDDLVKKQIEIL